MNTYLIIAIILAYIVIGRIFAQIYTNIEGFEMTYYDDDILWRTLFWPIILPYWLLNRLIEWIDDNFC